jgi:protein-S-isoprenylcysteine O-methyltransferase Ste14
MGAIIYQITGAVVFVVGVWLLGRWLRGTSTEPVASRAGVASHVLFHAFLFGPFWIGLLWVGGENFDRLAGIPSLPAITRIVGEGLVAVAAMLVAVCFGLIGVLGKGAPSFVMPKQIVVRGPYRFGRNPISLGWYLFCAGLALSFRSTYLLCYVVVALVPAHIFYLRYFEEMELELRFGESYMRYKQTVPFLLPRLIQRHRPRYIDRTLIGPPTK